MGNIAPPKSTCPPVEDISDFRHEEEVVPTISAHFRATPRTVHCTRSGEKVSEERQRVSDSGDNEEFVFEAFQDSAGASDMPCSQKNVKNLCSSSSTDSSEIVDEFETVVTDAEQRSILL